MPELKTGDRQTEYERLRVQNEAGRAKHDRLEQRQRKINMRRGEEGGQNFGLSPFGGEKSKEKRSLAHRRWR